MQCYQVPGMQCYHYSNKPCEEFTTSAGCRKTVFASRGQLCVHAAIRTMSGPMQKAACDNAVQTKGCTYWTRAMGLQDQKVRHLENIADIEDLVHVGMAKHVCPYFSTKELAQDADIIFMPYNYVTQELSSTPDLVKNTILILDEAHNVEAVCQDTASFDLTSGTCTSICWSREPTVWARCFPPACFPSREIFSCKLCICVHLGRVTACPASFGTGIPVFIFSWGPPFQDSSQASFAVALHGTTLRSATHIDVCTVWRLTPARIWDSRRCAFSAGHVALCLKEIDHVTNTLQSQLSRGVVQRAPPPFNSHAEALGTFNAMRKLVFQLEGKIAAHCDPKRFPQGCTKQANFGLSILDELKVNEDTVDVLMCGRSCTLCLLAYAAFAPTCARKAPTKAAACVQICPARSAELRRRRRREHRRLQAAWHRRPHACHLRTFRPQRDRSNRAANRAAQW
jgi:hypothetical protein